MFLLLTTAYAQDTAPWGRTLTAHVGGGTVDYAAIEASRGDLDTFVASVAGAKADPPLGTWLDAYNALVMRALIDAPALPAKVTDLPGFFDANKVTVAGRAMTLNELETQIRTTSKDPRIHFALNCGARSCPPLYPTPFPTDPKLLDQVLTHHTNAFLDGPGVIVDDAKREVRVTRLFEWYRDDFVQGAGSVEAFLKTWIANPAKRVAVEEALADGYVVTFQPYDWTPNAR